MCVMTLKTDGGTAATVSHSSPFPDYLNGAIYVGDDLGYLHMFTGTSFGEPGTKVGEAGSTVAIAENAPLNLGKGFPLGAPAYDTVSGCVFVGDSAGYLYKIDPGYAGGTVCNSGTFKLVATTAKLASGSANGILDSPIVDSNNQFVYVSVSSSSTAGGLSTGSNAIYEFQTTFAGSAAPQGSEAVGTGGSTLEFLDGDFDNVYYSSTNGTGNMYVVGNTHTTGGGTLYQIPVSANTMGTPVAMGTINSGSSHYAYASPIMEFCNNGGAACTATSTATTSGVDTIYFSTYEGAMSVLGHVVNLLTNTNCSVGGIVLVPGGCIYGVNVSTPSAPSVYAAYYTSWAASATNPCWVTGGFVVDNAQTSLLDLNTIGAGSQMYFVGMNGNSSSLLSSYDPCGATKTTGNVIDAQQIGQGDLVL
jgi:hypothetical protein